MVLDFIPILIMIMSLMLIVWKRKIRLVPVKVNFFLCLKRIFYILIFNERESMKMSSTFYPKIIKLFNRFVACWSQLFSKQEGIKQMVRTGGRG